MRLGKFTFITACLHPNKKLILIFSLLLTTVLLSCVSVAYSHEETTAECVYEWCDAILPKAGEKVEGKDNCGRYCSKHGIEIDNTKEKSISITLSKNEKNEPIMKASCPSFGLNKWEAGLIKDGFKAKLKVKKGKVYKIYEK